MSSDTETPAVRVYTAEDLMDETAAPRVGDIIHIGDVRSTYGGKHTFSSTDDFANVIGSSSDPKVDGLAWINLWKRTYPGVPVTQCSSLKFPTNSSFPAGFPCTTTFVGGHVILGQTASIVAQGSNSVYIIPICQKHNKNNGVYMMPITEGRAVRLNNYLKQ